MTILIFPSHIPRKGLLRPFSEWWPFLGSGCSQGCQGALGIERECQQISWAAGWPPGALRHRHSNVKPCSISVPMARGCRFKGHCGVHPGHKGAWTLGHPHYLMAACRQRASQAHFPYGNRPLWGIVKRQDSCNQSLTTSAVILSGTIQ